MSNKIENKKYFVLFTIRYRPNDYYIVAYDDFFKDGITYKIFEDRIEFRKPDIDSVKISKSSKRFHGFKFSLHITTEIKAGSYEFEEIEDEDLRVFYL